MIATGADFAGPGEFGRTRPAGPRSLVGLGKNRRPSARREPEAQRPLHPVVCDPARADITGAAGARLPPSGRPTRELVPQHGKALWARQARRSG
jgi:hypothetical protein